jgi:TRAP-type mannitol/chloroaromatic compound transport system permease small subunit
MGQPTRHDPYAALRILNFRWFIYSMLAMTVATQIQAVVVSWQIYELTHDPLSLGLIGLAEAVPFIGFALFAGHVADRIARLRISLADLPRHFLQRNCPQLSAAGSLSPGGGAGTA